MTDKRNALGGKPQGTGETQVATVISTESIPQPPSNPVATDIQWMCEFAQALDERTLVTWVLRLQNINATDNRRGYLWRELVRIELRRRKRNGGAA